VKGPGTRVVSEETNRHSISCATDVHDITDQRIVKVVGRATGAADNVERVSVQVDGTLVNSNSQHPTDNNKGFSALTGPPGAPPGIVISTLLLGSRP
jgi:hypothetical protein